MRKLITVLSFFSVVLVCSAGTAFAAFGPDLRVMPWQGPAQAMVRSPYQYTVTVKNIGNQFANGSKVVVEFPLTNTSPNRYILGKLSGYDTNICQVVSNKLQCSLGSINPNQTKSISFNFELPVSTRTLTFNAVASTTTSGDPQGNNQLSLTPVLAYGTRQITGPVNVLISRCTGNTSLSSFYECEVTPGSVANVMFSLNGDQSVSHTSYGYLGMWDQFASNQQLHMQLVSGTSVAEFSGFSTGGNCFEGMTTFGPGSAYVSAYKVCIQ
jgi:hypothetical protein